MTATFRSATVFPMTIKIHRPPTVEIYLAFPRHFKYHPIATATQRPMSWSTRDLYSGEEPQGPLLDLI